MNFPLFRPVAGSGFTNRFLNRVSVTSDVHQSKMVGVVISQVYLPFGGVIGGRTGGREL